MQDKQSLISIIIPTYNRPSRLRACLQSICDLREGHSIQTIVVNDGSTVPYDLAVKIFRSTLNLIYLEQTNQGPAAARNLGGIHATGRYLVFLDDDCTLPADWFQEVRPRIHIDRVIGGRTMNLLCDNTFSQASQVLIDYLYTHYNHDRENATFFTSNNMIIPKHIFDKLVGFDLDFSDAAAEDRDLCDRLLHSGFQMLYRPEIVIYHHHQMTLSNYIRQHYKYGYHAWLYHKKRTLRGYDAMRVEPVLFYTKLIAFPYARKLPNAWALSVLLLVSQIANTLGFMKAKLVSHGRERTRYDSRG